MFLLQLVFWPLWLILDVISFIMSTILQAAILAGVGIVVLRLSGRHDAGQQQLAEIAAAIRAGVALVIDRIMPGEQNSKHIPTALRIDLAHRSSAPLALAVAAAAHSPSLPGSRPVSSRPVLPTPPRAAAMAAPIPAPLLQQWAQSPRSSVGTAELAADHPPPAARETPFGSPSMLRFDALRSEQVGGQISAVSASSEAASQPQGLRLGEHTAPVSVVTADTLMPVFDPPFTLLVQALGVGADMLKMQRAAARNSHAISVQAAAGSPAQGGCTPPQQLMRGGALGMQHEPLAHASSMPTHLVSSPLSSHGLVLQPEHTPRRGLGGHGALRASHISSPMEGAPLPHLEPGRRLWSGESHEMRAHDGAAASAAPASEFGTPSSAPLGGLRSSLAHTPQAADWMGAVLPAAFLRLPDACKADLALLRLLHSVAALPRLGDFARGEGVKRERNAPADPSVLASVQGLVTQHGFEHSWVPSFARDGGIAAALNAFGGKPQTWLSLLQGLFSLEGSGRSQNDDIADHISAYRIAFVLSVRLRGVRVVPSNGSTAAGTPPADTAGGLPLHSTGEATILAGHMTVASPTHSATTASMAYYALTGALPPAHLWHSSPEAFIAQLPPAADVLRFATSQLKKRSGRHSVTFLRLETRTLTSHGRLESLDGFPMGLPPSRSHREVGQGSFAARLAGDLGLEHERDLQGLDHETFLGLGHLLFKPWQGEGGQGGSQRAASEMCFVLVKPFEGDVDAAEGGGGGKWLLAGSASGRFSPVLQWVKPCCAAVQAWVERLWGRPLGVAGGSLVGRCHTHVFAEPTHAVHEVLLAASRSAQMQEARHAHIAASMASGGTLGGRPSTMHPSPQGKASWWSRVLKKRPAGDAGSTASGSSRRASAGGVVRGSISAVPLWAESDPSAAPAWVLGLPGLETVLRPVQGAGAAESAHSAQLQDTSDRVAAALRSSVHPLSVPFQFSAAVRDAVSGLARDPIPPCLARGVLLAPAREARASDSGQRLQWGAAERQADTEAAMLHEMLLSGAFENTTQVIGPAGVQLPALTNWRDAYADSASASGSVRSLNCAAGGGGVDVAGAADDVYRGHSDALLHAVYTSGAATLSSSWGQPLLQHLSPGATAHLTCSLLTLQCRAVLGETSLGTFPYVITQRVSRVFHSALPGGRAVSDPFFTALLLAPPAKAPNSSRQPGDGAAEHILGISSVQ